MRDEMDGNTRIKAPQDSTAGAITFGVFALCFCAVLVMGTIKLGMMLFG